MLGMALPGGRNVATPRESILVLSRGSQLPYTQKKIIAAYYIYLYIYIYTDSRSTALAEQFVCADNSSAVRRGNRSVVCTDSRSAVCTDSRSAFRTDSLLSAQTADLLSATWEGP